LQLDPPRLRYVLHFPIKIVRVITDPFVDAFLVILSQLILPPVFQIANATLTLVTSILLSTASTLFGHGAEKALVDYAALTVSACCLYNHRIYLLIPQFKYEHVQNFGSALSPSGESVNLTEPAPSIVFSGFNALFDIEASTVKWSEPHFATLGRQVRLAASSGKTTWIRLALGRGSSERAFAVILGYGVIAMLFAVYLNVLTLGSVRTAGRAVRGTIQNQLVIVKVCVT
jgi:E3 ubiquitin-protein ligase MARCH6